MMFCKVLPITRLISQISDQPPSPATITNTNTMSPHDTTDADDIFGAASAPSKDSDHDIRSSEPTQRGAFDDLDDDFEGLEDAKEGSADDDFANISRSGLDDFNHVFDSSPPGSQAKSESTAFGNESSFDFVSHNSATGGTSQASGGAQQKDNHDWDAIFAGLDEPTTSQPPHATDTIHQTDTPVGSAPAVDGSPSDSRPPGPGRALTTTGEHDDPILKNLTGMGYSRGDSLVALEKYDYNLERVSQHDSPTV